MVLGALATLVPAPHDASHHPLVAATVAMTAAEPTTPIHPLGSTLSYAFSMEAWGRYTADVGGDLELLCERLCGSKSVQEAERRFVDIKCFMEDNPDVFLGAEEPISADLLRGLDAARRIHDAASGWERSAAASGRRDWTFFILGLAASVALWGAQALL